MARTNAGATLQVAQMFQAAASGAATGVSRASDYIALTQNTGAPALTDTVLPGEETANGLARKQGTVSYTAGTTNVAISAAFTYTGTGITIAGAGLFNAASGGTLFARVLNSLTSVLGQNDSITQTFTITI
ncbi:MAG: hypothetical protein PGN13_16300 [Patulibacter minatonensis]